MGQALLVGNITPNRGFDINATRPKTDALQLLLQVYRWSYNG